MPLKKVNANVNVRRKILRLYCFDLNVCLSRTRVLNAAKGAQAGPYLNNAPSDSG